MSRRHVGPADSNSVVGRYLRTVDFLPERLTSQSLFGNELPLELEIGSGKGLFIATASAKRPGHNFLGVEIAHAYAMQSASRLAKAGVSNALMVSGDAEPLLQGAFPRGSLAAVHIYFPDPWWKKKHKKRRVINSDSVGNIFDALAVEGTFHFWTDVLEYFESAIEMISVEFPFFGPPVPEEVEVEGVDDHGGEDVGAYRTHFDRRSLLHGIPVYRVRYVKHL